MVVAVCGITFAFQTNTYAKKNFKVTPSKVEKQSKKSFRTITTKYTKHYLGLNAFLDKMEKAGGGTLMQRRRVSEEVSRYVKLYQQGRK